MPLVDIDGVNINFPFQPYTCQVAYMKKVVESLKKKQNAILESPTGTGKTLCLLCSSLAWLEDAKARAEFKKLAGVSSLVSDDTMSNDSKLAMFAKSLEQATGSSMTWGGLDYAIPKIIYSSRTHSQLAQAIQELKRSAYSSVKVSLIGSREQLCLHETVKREANNVAKVHMCKAKVASRSCTYYNHFDGLKKNGNIRASVGNIADMEDLMKFGEKHKTCPYYVARELKSDADIHFMPYNYILDTKSRKAHSVELQGNIVIFDEAHNLERICEESSSFDLTSTDVATAIEEVDHLSEKLVQFIEGDDRGFEDDSKATAGPEFTLDDLLRLKGTLKSLEDIIDSFDLKPGGKGITKPGIFMYELLAKINLTFESKAMILELLDNVITYMTADATSAVLNTKGRGLAKFSDILKIAFTREPPGTRSIHEHQEMLAKSYKVHVSCKEEFKKKSVSSWATTAHNDKPNKTLSYWCFSPGHTMKELVSHGVHSIILTSGTLSPLSSFTAEMQIPFEIRLENPHVIEKHQMWVGSIATGPDNARLNSTYQFRDTPAYKASLGRTVVNLSRVVPDGLLIFFPSYPVMQKCAEFWQGESGIWNLISNNKAIFMEPRNKDDFNKAMVDYYERIGSREHRGAIFMAVCRGKVSEGLDFSDCNGRAVVITGLPFPPKMDPKIVLKMQYLDEMARQPREKGVDVLSGNSWYTQQASRAVNQAVGRVIRHKDDYGAIILCDDRFLNQNTINQLPKWIIPQVLKFPKFGPTVKQVKDFFDLAYKKMPQPTNKERKPATTNHSDATPSSSTTLPQFTRHHTNTTRIRVEPACQVNDHVPSLAGEMSELKGQYSSVTSGDKPKSLLDALRTNETGGVNIKKSPQMPMQLFATKLTTQDGSKSAAMRNKIIVKRTSSESSNTNDKVVVGPEHRTSASTYISQVKSMLSAESYKRFSSVLQEYKKFENISVTIEILADIFTQTPTHQPLLKDFYTFVRPHHKQQFSEMCRNVTGLDCGYRHEHSLPKKHQHHSSDSDRPEKRAKLNSDGKINTVKTTFLSNSENSVELKNKTASPNTNKIRNYFCSPNSEVELSSVNNVDAKDSEFRISHCSSKRTSENGNSNSQKIDSRGSLYHKPLVENSMKTSTIISKSTYPSNSKNENHCTSSDKFNKIIENPSISSTDKVQCDNSAIVKQSNLPDKLKDINESNDRNRDVNNETTKKPKKEISYECCVCKKEKATQPVVSQCKHLACGLCWKQIFETTKQCPACNLRVKAKQMTKVFYPLS